ncbi:hypothetical protein P175DRAFT_0178828 [Aspergillus ochraceoroseus IBT 24754]|uniref:Uncharacterized protein n=1 Tax=Aspergillus ochraceoroseus IBT 24754 TaxID=1392256 RepID=A0A2T5M523_9EURO|nr:uncharacterized protein P175DRAFT_0178828 [Aspergillus ochraceoroseus IBT 24754]PTU23606.1 hypothetical protein P175DRAFT_0178828 [Aspergillus ochraceoroseus IBT 24754]
MGSRCDAGVWILRTTSKMKRILLIFLPSTVRFICCVIVEGSIEWLNYEPRGKKYQSKGLIVTDRG